MIGKCRHINIWHTNFECREFRKMRRSERNTAVMTLRHMMNPHLWGFRKILVPVVSLLMIVGTSATLAQEVESSAVPSNAMPASGERITVAVYIDMAQMPNPDSLLGGYSARLEWDSTVVEYVGNSGPLNGLIGVVNDQDASSGLLIFNGINTGGLGGRTTILEIEFDAIGSGNSSTLLDLSFSSMASALTFIDLLPYLKVLETNIQVEPTVDIREDEQRLPDSFKLQQNFPPL